MADTESLISKFSGLKDDTDPKQTPPEYFTKAENWNFPNTGLPGVDVILMPDQINTIGTHSIDGLFEYRFLDTNNVLQTQQIGFTNGSIYKTALGTEVLVKSGLTAGRVSVVAFNDKLFIANGSNYVNVYYGSLGVVAEMGAPAAVANAASGNPSGAYYYAMTYVTAAGEEVMGSVSNTITVTSKKIDLTLPFGYDGTLSRNIYRTVAGGSTLKLLTTIADNTTQTYQDNIADGSLSTTIPATGINELPKPHFLAVANQSLFATKVGKYPTQLFKTDANIEVISVLTFIDIANYGNDNTPVEGMGIDFSKIIVGTGKQIYIVEPSDTVVGINTVKPTRANVGMKSGYSCVSVPASGAFRGGLVFVSTLNDVRVINGQDELPVATVLGNVQTENWSQDIRGSLSSALQSYSNIAAEFFDYRYHLAVDNIKFVFDIRVPGWTTHHIKSASYESKPRCFAVMGTSPQKFYNGQSDGNIEQEYVNIKYRGEDVKATLISAYLEVSRLFKWFKKLVFWFKTSLTSSTDISVVLDSNSAYPITSTIPLYGGVFNPVYFDATYFLTSDKGESDYRVVNITTPCRWAQWTLTCTSGNISFLQWGAVGEALRNKEATA
jgi:hypothetical protein